MPVNVAFSEMILDLRAETRRSQNPAVGKQDLPVLKRLINRNYRLVWLMHQWQNLKMRPVIPLQAGERYYDLPEGAAFDAIKKIKIRYNTSFDPVTRGITIEDYNAFDSEAGERNEPVLKWDLAFDPVAGKTMLEVWPIPSTNSQTLYVETMFDVPPLVEDGDICRVDSDPVVLYSAAELLKSADAKDSDDKRQMANEFMRLLKIRTGEGGADPTRIGLGRENNPSLSGRASVRISG